MKTKDWLTIKEASEIAGVSTDSIRRWADLGYIIHERTEGKHRRISFNSLKKYIKDKDNTKDKYALIYARVPHSKSQSELKEQITRLENYCAKQGWQYRIMSDIALGIDFNRKKLNKLLNLITNQRISKLVLNYRDSLFLFGNEIIFELCKMNNIEVIILSKENYLLTEKEALNELDKLKNMISLDLLSNTSEE